MTYYNDEKVEFTVDGERTLLTEEHAERLIAEGYQVDPVWTIANALPDGAADELLECSCPPELPDGRCFPLCPACKLMVDEDIPIPGYLERSQ